MDGTEIFVVIAGIAAITFRALVFFREAPQDGCRHRRKRRAGDPGHVKGGYSPDLIVVRRGVPVRLNFYRDETASCNDQIVFGDFGIARDLPAYKTTQIEFTPEKAGEFTFACGMQMMRDKPIVESE